MSEHAAGRREFLKQAAAAAWSTPLILTLAARPAGAQQTSCAPPGSPCGSWDSAIGICLNTGAVFCCGDCIHEDGDGIFCFCVDA